MKREIRETIENSDISSLSIASILAGFGISTNKLSAIIGSILISPLSEPIINIINDPNYVNSNDISTLCIYLCICTIIGLVFYFIYYGLMKQFEFTDIMSNYTQITFFDAAYAFIYGLILYYISQTNLLNNQLQLVTKIMIGLSVLPYFVNTGILLASNIKHNNYITLYKSKNNLLMGILYIFNILGGIIIGKFLYKIDFHNIYK